VRRRQFLAGAAATGAAAGVLAYLGTRIGGGHRAAELHPLLSTADWYIDAVHNGPAPSIRDLAGDNDASPVGNMAKLLLPNAWSGLAAIATVERTGGWEEELTWPTDFHFTVEAKVLPHHDNGQRGEWAEMANISADPIVTRDHLEPAFVFREDGSLRFGWDADYNGESDPFGFVSDDIGETYAEGIDWATWAFRLDTDNGDDGYHVTITKDDVEVAAFTGEGVVAIEEPADTIPFRAGTYQYLVPVRSWQFLDGIDGDPLVSFDADDPTGWDPYPNSITTAPAYPSWYGSVGGSWQPANTADFDIEASDSVTFAWYGRPAPGRAGIYLGRGGGAEVAAGVLLGAPAEGFWAVAIADLDASFRFVICDGTNTVTAVIGDPPEGDAACIVVLDRAEDELRVYVDGELVDAADASALGEVAPSSSVDVWSGQGFLGRMLRWDEARADIDEITAAISD
jgi:hypothetical protein